MPIKVDYIIVLSMLQSIGKVFYFTSEFNTADEYFGHVNRLITDSDFRCELQESTAKIVREIVNNEEQGEILKKFLENLI